MYFEGNQALTVKTISTLKWHLKYLLVPTPTWSLEIIQIKLHRLMTQSEISVYSTTDDRLTSDTVE